MGGIGHNAKPVTGGSFFTAEYSLNTHCLEQVTFNIVYDIFMDSLNQNTTAA